MTTHDLREITGLTQREFANEFRIPISTIKNWDSRGTMPEYLHRAIYQNIQLIRENIVLLKKLGKI